MTYAQYFTPEEFREWSDDMSPRLVTMLDVLRFRLGSAIEISGSKYALGRNLGRDDLSEHNIDHWGEVLAWRGKLRLLNMCIIQAQVFTTRTPA